jgi:hypothetical protein
VAYSKCTTDMSMVDLSTLYFREHLNLQMGDSHQS